MESNPNKYIERMLEVVNKKNTLLQDIYILSQAQAETIDEDGIDALQQLIDSKQTKINEIDKLDDEFEVYFKRLKQELKVSSLDEVKSAGFTSVAALQASIREVMSLIKDISDIESNNNEKAKNLLDELGSKIKTLNQSNQVKLAYGQKPITQSSSYFIDKKK